MGCSGVFANIPSVVHRLPGRSFTRLASKVSRMHISLGKLRRTMEAETIFPQ
jgi:hypothetical protein